MLVGLGLIRPVLVSCVSQSVEFGGLQGLDRGGGTGKGLIGVEEVRAQTLLVTWYDQCGNARRLESSH